MHVHVDASTANAALILVSFSLYLAYEARIEPALWSACRWIRTRLQRRKTRQRRSGIRLPRFPRHMRIIRHPDGQQETLALFERD